MDNLRKLFQNTKIKYKLMLIFAIDISYVLIVASIFEYGSYRRLMLE